GVPPPPDAPAPAAPAAPVAPAAPAAAPFFLLEWSLLSYLESFSAALLLLALDAKSPAPAAPTSTAASTAALFLLEPLSALFVSLDVSSLSFGEAFPD